ncbi:MAG: PP2C family protein-serine/threonine phosphatase, partial [Actinomycetota bacterium]
RSTADGVAEAIDATIAGSIRVSTTVSDDIVVARQHQPMTLAAELQRRLLPPDSFTSAGVAVSAAVEPAYDTGGDVFDYAIDGRSLFLAVLDARGHGLQAATTATVATSALRRARRTGADLVAIATEVAVAVNSIGIDHDFVSAVLVDLDLTTGSGRSLTAGHLPPLIVDGTVQAMPLEPTLPLGLVVRGNQSEPVIQDFQLQHGQSLVLYSDGIIENAAQDDGIAVGDDRFQRALLRHIESTEGGRHLARSVVEELLAITGPRLRDDATLMITTR